MLPLSCRISAHGERADVPEDPKCGRRGGSSRGPHSHFYGECRVMRRAKDAIRARSWMILLLIAAVAARAMPVPATIADARVSLKAIMATISQIELAVKMPEGMWALALLLKSEHTSLITAWERWLLSASTVFSVLVMKNAQDRCRVKKASGASSAFLFSFGMRRTTNSTSSRQRVGFYPWMILGHFRGIKLVAFIETHSEMAAFAQDVFASLPRADQRNKGNLYLHGQMLDGSRKSVQPMGGRRGVAYQQLRQFVCASPWEFKPVRRVLVRKAIEVIGHDAWVVD